MAHYDLCIVGAGILGETVARAAQSKRKALLALPGSPETYSQRLHAFLAGVPVNTEPDSHLSIDRFSGPIEFLSPTALKVGNDTIEADKFVLILGSVPKKPQRDLKSYRQPLDAPISVGRVTILGAGPVAVTLAQRFALEKKTVSLVHEGALLGKEDSDAVAHLATRLKQEGVQIGQEIDAPEEFLFAGGMKGNVDGMALEKTGVFVRPDGHIAVDDEMRTSVKNIFAVGAVTGQHEF
jgi:pyruvate/2-oxoglutarate dehydrogenase complex dihydrolipoamide dehydrogenase (E3) component